MAQASRAAKNLIYKKMRGMAGAAKLVGQTMKTMVTRPFTNSDIKQITKR